MLIDSNILIYAVNEDSPKHKLSQKFLHYNRGKLSLSHQNILEAIRVLTHPKYSQPMNPKLAVDAVLSIAGASRIIIPNNMTQYIATEFIKLFKLAGNRIFDAYLAATALSNDINIIATDNTKDFKKFTELKIINPFV